MPAGETSMFVLLQHDPPLGQSANDRLGTHWDFLLELDPDQPLATWRLQADPRTSVMPIPAERLPDHRRLYLDYEGEISGGRGYVRRIDRGPATIESFDGRRLSIVLAGSILTGRFEITPRHPDSSELLFRRTNH